MNSRLEHVTCSRNGEISFDYAGRSGKQQEQAVNNPVTVDEFGFSGWS